MTAAERGTAQVAKHCHDTVMIAKFHFESQVLHTGFSTLKISSFVNLDTRVLSRPKKKSKRFHVHVPRGDGVQAMLKTPLHASCKYVCHWESCHSVECIYEDGETYERTKRSRLSQSGFLGLKVMNLLKRTWATGAMPIGAPGWPELAAAVASTWRKMSVSN
jgi:hypothetical protein